MLDNLKLDKVIFIDIETVSQEKEYSKLSKLNTNDFPNKESNFKSNSCTKLTLLQRSSTSFSLK
jgi:hypothetical protein